jgi:hypothetical protein
MAGSAAARLGVGRLSGAVERVRGGGVRGKSYGDRYIIRKRKSPAQAVQRERNIYVEPVESGDSRTPSNTKKLRSPPLFFNPPSFSLRQSDPRRHILLPSLQFCLLEVLHEILVCAVPSFSLVPSRVFQTRLSTFISRAASFYLFRLTASLKPNAKSLRC